MRGSPLLYRLEPTGDAKRDRAIATQSFSAGDLILSVRPLATVLLPFQKGRRCDYCLQPLDSTQRCSVCKEYWYCDRRCAVPYDAWFTKTDLVPFSVQAKRRIGRKGTNIHAVWSKPQTGNLLPRNLLCLTFWTRYCSFIYLTPTTRSCSNILKQERIYSRPTLSFSICYLPSRGSAWGFLLW